jgi:hypothetical protein
MRRKPSQRQIPVGRANVSSARAPSLCVRYDQKKEDPPYLVREVKVSGFGRKDLLKTKQALSQKALRITVTSTF